MRDERIGREEIEREKERENEKEEKEGGERRETRKRYRYIERVYEKKNNKQGTTFTSYVFNYFYRSKQKLNKHPTSGTIII